VVVSMGLLVLSLSVPEFYLTKDKSSAVDDQVERKTIEKVCIEENPQNYVDAFLEPWGGGGGQNKCGCFSSVLFPWTISKAIPIC
jgi:hypothetical protein